MIGPAASDARKWLAIALVLAALFATALAFRPVLPIDETRYLSVAWEMFLRDGWFEPLTLNFEPYHQKPPMLFWLIGLAWSAFGVSRWAALAAVMLASMASLYLTAALCRRLLPGLEWRTTLVMLGSFGYLLYCSVFLFDLTLTLFVLGSLLSLHAYAGERRVGYVLAMGLFLGCGVLTKGPVAYLYWAFPFLFGPFWVRQNRGWISWYAGGVAALLVSAVPVLSWLVPVLGASSDEFGYWLLWEQTAGRVTGSYRISHARPFYFFLLVLPLLLLPWILMPALWRGIAAAARGWRDSEGMRFLLAWILPTVIAFSLISGKQPHYMVPLLPGLAMLVARASRAVSERRLQAVAAVMIVLFIGAHAVASVTLFSRFDLSPEAEYLRQNRDRDWTYSGDAYRGELTFLARLEKPVANHRIAELPAWFAAHPHGFAVIDYYDPAEVAGFDKVLSRDYRGHWLGIFTRRETP